MSEQRDALRVWVSKHEGDGNAAQHQLMTPSGSRPYETPREGTLSRVDVARKANWGARFLVLGLLVLIGGGAFVGYTKFLRQAPKPEVQSSVSEAPVAATPLPTLSVPEPVVAAPATSLGHETGTSEPAQDPATSGGTALPGPRRRQPGSQEPSPEPTAAPTAKPKPKPPVIDDLGENPYR